MSNGVNSSKAVACYSSTACYMNVHTQVGRPEAYWGTKGPSDGECVSVCVMVGVSKWVMCYIWVVTTSVEESPAKPHLETDPLFISLGHSLPPLVLLLLYSSNPVCPLVCPVWKPEAS